MSSTPTAVAGATEPSSPTSEQTIESADGTKLRVYQWLPAAAQEDHTQAQLVIAHGYLEHGMRYNELATALSHRHAIAVTVYDFRGHGQSSGPRGHVSNWRDYHADLTAVLATLNKDTPQFLLGHSNGGLVCLDYVTDPLHSSTVASLSGLLISSPWLGPATQLPAVKVWASKLLGRLAPRLSLSAAEEVASERLTNDVAKQDQHRTDTRNLSRLTVGWAYQSMLAQQRVTQDRCGPHGGLDALPLWWAYATDDQVADAALNRKIGDLWQVTDKTVVPRPNCQHEIFNEVDREDLYEKVATWVLDRANAAAKT